MIRYVLGLVFDPNYHKTVIVEKQRPTWMQGRMNAPGGRVKEDESYLDAVAREAHEETGIDIDSTRWHWFANLNSDTSEYEVLCFHASAPNIMKAHGRVVDGERVLVSDVYELRAWKLVPDMEWLVHAAIMHHYHPHNFFESMRSAPFHL